jgi:amidase
MLDCTAGLEPGDPYTAPIYERSFAEAIARPPRKLKIALMLKDHRGAKLHPECLEAVRRAAELCASLGHVVEEADPNLDMVALLPLNSRISAANTARSCDLRWKALGREPNADDVEAVTWAVYQRGLKVSGIEYIEAIAAAHAAGRKMGTFLLSYDVILSTMLAGPPPKLGYFKYLCIGRQMACRSACISQAATVRRRPCWRLPPSWRQRNHGSIACRRCKERHGTQSFAP